MGKASKLEKGPINAVSLIDTIVKFEVRKETESLKFKITQLERRNEEREKYLESLIRVKLQIYKVLQVDGHNLFNLQIVSIQEDPQGLIINVKAK